MIQDNMAALMRHGFLKGGQGLKTLSDNAFMLQVIRFKTNKRLDPKRKNLPGKTVIPPIREDLDRNYLRPHKDYDPPQNVEEQFERLCESILGESFNHAEHVPHEYKFQLLNACFQTFKHCVPNGILHTIKSPDDILQFYKTRVVTKTPLEALKEQTLPPNLHVLYDYHRFHPDTDTMFGSVSAFPKSSTIVSSVKYKKKYPGYKAKTSWP